MEFMLENERLAVRLLSKGAELAGVQDKKTGRECIWQATPPGWDRHAPLLFPHCGKLFDNQLLAKGEKHPAAQHGFARDMEFAGRREGDTVVFTAQANEATRALYPYEFELEVAFSLQGNRLTQRVRVTNPQATGDPLPFTLGFHPGFTLPLRPGATTADHEVVFDKTESPVVVETPIGYVTGETRVLFENGDSLALADDTFQSDSICMQGLRSGSMTLQPRNAQPGDPYVRVDITDFPYVLLWGPSSPKGADCLPFVCIEPWHSLPDGPEPYGEFTNKPGLFHLAPQQSYETDLRMEFGPA